MPTRVSSAARCGWPARLTTEQRLRDISRFVGTVLQDPAKQIVGATVEAELAFGPENLGIERAEIRRRIGDVADRAGIRPLLGRETSALSGGERQLLAMGGILMLEPRLYVVDEPLANLDPASAARLLAILRTLADEGHAIVIVEHRVEEALDLRPDRVLYLEEGVTRYLGDVAGFLRVADPDAVKLPFDAVLERFRAEPALIAPAAGRRRAAQDVHESPDAGGDGARASSTRGSGPATAISEVLHGIDARFGRREVVAVLGPNGSGKTTLFRTAMRLLPTTAGEVRVDGAPVAGPDGRPARVHVRLRLPEPQPDALRPDGPRGARLRPPEPGPGPGDVRRDRRRGAPADLAGSARGHPRAAAADPVVRPAEAARPGDRAGPRAADADPRRAVRGPGPPHRPAVHARGRSRSRTSNRSTS